MRFASKLLAFSRRREKLLATLFRDSFKLGARGGRAWLLAGLLSCALFFPLAESQSAPQNKTHICFFELDNTTTSKNFKAKIKEPGQSANACKKRQEFSGGAVVHCYQPQIGKDEKGGEAFERMIKEMSEKGEKCDSLVISGHHTGDWKGETGTLQLKEMEALSCQPEYRDWFSRIKALWLDGCNTVTDNFIKSVGIVKSPDSETVRVAGKHGNLEKSSLTDYQQAYAGSLDESAPLSSRYLRMFPETQIYGFNGAAPAWDEDPEKDQIKDQSFIYQHLTNLGQALRAESENESAINEFERGFQAMFSNDPCDDDKLDSWEKQCDPNDSENCQADFQAVENQDYEEARRLGCALILAKQVGQNPNSLEAQKALAENILQNPRSTEKQKELAKEILAQPDSEKALTLAKSSVLDTLKAVNLADRAAQEENKKISHLLFNNLYETWGLAKKLKDESFFNDVKAQLQKQSFSDSLKERIRSDYAPSLRKADYIKFYMEVHDLNRNHEFIRSAVDGLFLKAQNVFPDLKSPRQANLPTEAKRALAVSVADQLLQYDLLSEEQIKNLLDSSDLFPKDGGTLKTNNPLVADIWHKLSFSQNSAQIISTIPDQRSNPILRKSAIRTGAALSFKQFERRAEEAKRNLEELAGHIYTGQGIAEGSDPYTFFNALHSYLRGKTAEEQVNFLYDLGAKKPAQDEEYELQALILRYADRNSNSSVKADLCERIKDTKRLFQKRNLLACG